MTTEMKLYQSEDLQVKLDVLVENEDVWLSQKQMAILYGTVVPAISKHIKNIFESGELQANPTVSKMEIVQQEGDRTVCRTTTMYNMDMIIAVGYRVNSIQATNFRIWATQVLKEYLYRYPPFTAVSFSSTTTGCTLSGPRSRIWGRNCFVSR